MIARHLAVTMESTQSSCRPVHWQSWLQNELPQTRRVDGIDWEKPVLGPWPPGKAILAALIEAQPDVPLTRSTRRAFADAVGKVSLAKLRHGTQLSCSF
jgi:hypothetical protein